MWIRNLIRLLSLIFILIVPICFLIANPNYISNEHKYTADSLFLKGKYYYENKEYNKALDYFTQSYKIDSIAYMDDRPQVLIYTAMWIGNTLYKLGREHEISDLAALYYQDTPIDYTNANIKYIDSLSNLGKSYYETDLDKAIELFSLRQGILDSIVGKNHIWACMGRSIIIDLLSIKQQKECSFDSKDFSINKCEDIAKQASFIYPEYLNGLIRYYSGQELVTKLIEFCQTTNNFPSLSLYSDITERTIGIIDSIKRKTLYTQQDKVDLSLALLADICYQYVHIARMMQYMDTSKQINLYNKSISYSEQAIENLQSFEIADIWPVLSFCLHTKSQCLNELRYIFDSENIDILPDYKLYEINSANTPTDSIYMQKVNHSEIINSIAQTINSLAKDEELINDIKFNELSPISQQYFNFEKERLKYLYKYDKPAYYESLEHLATEYKSEHLLTESLSARTELCEYYSSIRDFVNTYESLYKLAKLYESFAFPLFSRSLKLKNNITPNEMAQYEIKAWHLYNNIISKFDTEKSIIQSSLSNMDINTILRYRNNAIESLSQLIFRIAETTAMPSLYDEALIYLQQAQDISEYDIEWYNRAISICMAKGSSKNLYNLEKVQRERFEDAINSFKYATYEQKSTIWNSVKYILDDNIAICAELSNDILSGAVAYNALLLRKGILLMADKNFIDEINNTNIDDPVFIEARTKLMAIRNGDLLVSQKEQYAIERELLLYIKDIDYFTNTTYTWMDVRAALNYNECAIEFCEYNTNSYLAVLLTPNSKYPTIFILPTWLENIDSKNITHEQVSLFWESLGLDIFNYEKIYFSPDGIIHSTPIENFSNELFDNSFIRLSSTRELINRKHDSIKYAILYGGLKYNANMQVLTDDIGKYPNVYTRDIYSPNVVDSISLRGGVNELPETKIEIENIAQSLQNSTVQYSLFTDIDGSEASFKHLSGKKVNMIHIATHGFYCTETEVRNSKFDFLQFNYDTTIYMEDKALTRSGLLFSGANNALMGKPIPENAEDGILTAKEIAGLDLRGLDLVVLSACQTGLGEITGDGVFGLQRGFKKAGANSLMMSLWKVDDKATQILMSRFYENLIAGKSKYESLRDAQRYVREYEQEIEVNIHSNHRPITAREREQVQKNESKEKQYKIVRPYQDPKYWAAFILLDGIN